jgi:Tfp pilus assembly protein PilN
VSTMTDSRALWNTMPGWGIVANLLPPEVVQSRRVRFIRRMVLLGLVFVLLACLIAYAYVYLGHRSAEHDLAAEQARSQQLTVQQHQYNAVVQIKGDTAQVRTQLSGLLGQDVNTAALITKITQALPAGTAISTLTVTVNTATAQGTAAASNTTGSLDTSGNPHIGTITVTGTAKTTVDVATYVDKLTRIPGLVDVFPTSNTSTDDTGTHYTIDMALTSTLLSHAYDVKPGGN